MVTKRIDEEAKVQERRTKLLAAMAAQAVAAARAEASVQIKQIKSDIKKTTALQKKIRNMASDSVNQVIETITKLNLSHFRAEIANAFLEVRARVRCFRSAARWLKAARLLLGRNYATRLDSSLAVGCTCSRLAGGGAGDVVVVRLLRLLLLLLRRRRLSCCWRTLRRCDASTQCV